MIIPRTVASFSGLNTHNLTNRTFIHSDVLTSWTRSSTTMKRLCVHTGVHAYNNNVMDMASVSARLQYDNLYSSITSIHSPGLQQ